METQFYGVDWLAMMLTFFALWQIGNQNKLGFAIMMAGNLAWIAVGVLTHSMAMVAANVVFLSMNFRAILKWSSA